MSGSHLRMCGAHPGANSAAPQLRQSALASSSLRMRSGVFPFPQRFDLRDALVAAKLVFVRLLATDLAIIATLASSALT